jgi:diguanylate cyclase (GGDEF)-like protein
MNRAVFTPWVDALLGTDRHQRVRAKQALIACAIYVAIGTIIGLGVLLGLVEALPAALLNSTVIGLSVVFYGLIRSGVNLRFPSDPALTQAQGLFCVLAACACYLVAGPARGAILMTVMIGQVFGIFALTPSQARRMAMLGVSAFGITMAGAAAVAPLRYPPRVELLHFLLVVLMLPTIGWLTGTLSAIRNKLRQQKVRLENALQQNRLLATQDELTGLSNRRHMTAMMVAERGRQQRNRAPISMVMLDIDHFKRINDSCGHQAGDQVLQIFADVISHSLRAGDALSRWGGEEFLLMLPGTTAEEALICVERMRGHLAARSFEHLAPKLTVTFSAGIGVCSVDDRTDTIIERADRAMYRAKTAGRNRTVVA